MLTISLGRKTGNRDSLKIVDASYPSSIGVFEPRAIESSRPGPAATRPLRRLIPRRRQAQFSLPPYTTAAAGEYN